MGLQFLRLLLFRNSAHDGVAHDVAVPVNHIGGGIGKDIGGELSRLTVGSEIHILIGRTLLSQYIEEKYPQLQQLLETERDMETRVRTRERERGYER